MADDKDRVTVSVEELALSNSVTVAALVELLDEKGVVSGAEVLARVKRIKTSSHQRTAHQSSR